jgi:release factor glutamine methyltransferase
MSSPDDPPATIVAALRGAGCVFAEDEAALLVAATRSESELGRLVERRVGGEPLEYILGWAEFNGIRIAVDPGVFVPRRRTEFMAITALALLAPLRDPAADPTVVDLCCGSGAVGRALIQAWPALHLHAADIDPAAVRCAERNLTALGASTYQGDLYQALPGDLRGGVDLIVANAPYVPTDAIQLMPPEARLYEPTVALNGGGDGLDVLRRVIAGAPLWLSPAGHLIVESSEQQAGHLVTAAESSGLSATVHHSDDLDATVVVATTA